MKHRLYISFIAVSMLVSQVNADGVWPIAAPKNWTWVGSISAGPVWADGGETQTFFLAPEIEKSYVANKSTNVMPSGELFIGMQRSLSPQWLGQLGLAAAASGDTKLQGQIWDDAEAAFDNYSYQYKIQNSRIAVKGKLLFDKGYWLMPWISASLGVGFNDAHDFTNTPLIFEAVPNANFTDNTKTTFTYTLGVGVQKSINNHWQAGAGYEFSDWGNSELGRAVGQTLGSGLVLNHLYTSEFQLNLTYVA